MGLLDAALLTFPSPHMASFIFVMKREINLGLSLQWLADIGLTLEDMLA